MAAAAVPAYYFHTIARRDALAAAHDEVRRHADIAAGTAADRLRRAETLHVLGRVAAQRWLESGDARIPAFALAEIRTLLANSNAAGRDDRLSIVTPDGQVLWNSLTIRQDLSIADRDYFQDILAGRAARVFSSPLRSKGTGTEVTAYAEAVRGGGGALLAVTVVTLPPSSLVTIGVLQSDDIHVSAAVLRPDGQYITAPPAALGHKPPPPGLRAMALANGAAESAASDSGTMVLHRIPGFDLLLQLNADAAPVLAQVDRQFMIYDLAGAALIVLAVGAITLASAMRRRAADHTAARRASDAMHLVTDNINEIILLFELDHEGGLHRRFVSPSIRRILGIAPEDLIETEAQVPMPAEDRAAVEASLAALYRGEAAPDQQIRAFDAAANLHWFNVATRRIDEDPRFPARRFFLSSWRDITESKQTEAALARRDIRIESLVANIRGGMYDCDFPVDGEDLPGRIRVHYMSPGIPMLSGYSAEELSKPGAFEMMTSRETAERRDAFLHDVLEHGEAAFEFDLNCADGRVLRIRERARRISGDRNGGNIVGFAIDVSDEVELRERLVEAGRLALLGELAASIAHEINQPLSVVALRAAMLKEASAARPWSQERVAASGTLIEQMVERVAVVVHSIREFARRDSAAPEPFDPAKACAAAVVIVEPHLKLRPATFRTTAPDAPLAALGHVGSFEQVLINLFTNAIDAYDHARPDAERLIEVAIAGAADHVMVTVTDHAGGIPDEALPKLFDAFFTTKPAGKGTGLGLAICHRIMRDMGGTITAANTADGAAFTLTVPMAA